LWASSTGASKVNFLMVCVELGRTGLRTAQAFGQQFQLPASVVNGYIEQRSESPSFGQLGCQGFVALGPHGEFAVQRTIPCYLEASQGGFTAVEKLFSELWSINLTATQPSVSTTKPLASVGVPALDMEHETLEKTVQELQSSQSLEVMQRLLALWQQHSEHEEKLFEEYDFGQHRTAEPGLAATKSHCEHHRLIASMMQKSIQVGLASGCCIAEVAAEIQRHTDVYDAAYAGKLGVQSQETPKVQNACLTS